VSDYKEVAKNSGWSDYEEYTPRWMYIPGRSPLKRATDAMKRAWKKHMRKSRRRKEKKQVRNEQNNA